MKLSDQKDYDALLAAACDNIPAPVKPEPLKRKPLSPLYSIINHEVDLREGYSVHSFTATFTPNDFMSLMYARGVTREAKYEALEEVLLKMAALPHRSQVVSSWTLRSDGFNYSVCVDFEVTCVL